ncbi:RagB/SusD family nutrient uptake outer membrane protein [uncultured Proteiniphilum sp.]|uniref:RagB/SusD family nutrient uptake outer membrane protein n=1 Tax=uncultured Proteiniphilum sp. TaxID=497637 RepID=UPI00262DA2D7|nr:RagB/SusD family nutrient uptake outer membrane protein [uncultured Proteiniphilum sp.]
MKPNIIVVSLFLATLCGCSLDYENTGTINPGNVWTDKTMINSFLTDIYGRMTPGWPIAANGTDEGMNGPTSMGDYARGLITVENTGQKWDYGNIDRINFFLDQMEKVTVLSDEEMKQLKGQALFWRAWDYWGKVFSTGGVPLILHFQDVTNLPSLFVSRNSTSECVAQIIKDLDEAIASLPDTWTGANYGRIDKGCAMAFKGRVLLQYASPLFNPGNDQSRWEAAYKANKDAVDFLKGVGKGLYTGKFEDIWYNERNNEVVMINQFYYPDHKLAQNSIRPEPLTKDNANFNQAIFPLLMAFPKLDGSKLELDVNRLDNDAAYNEQFMTDFYVGRDPRFYATIFCPGTFYPASDQLTNGMKYWNAWRKVPDELSETGYKYNTLIFDQLGKGVGGSSSGYFQLKGLDKSLTIATVYDGITDWIEIRFTEVLMNYGECANELDKSSEALQVLYDVRKRAGIQAGTGNYGITAVSQSDIRQAYMDERFIEFAYEGKRWSDIRRWKRYDMLNALKWRSGLHAVIKDYDNIGSFDWTKDMYDPEVRKLFLFEYVECLDGDKKYQFNLDLNHWFYPVHKDVIDRNSKIEQNNEWGGAFDPLK